METCRNPDYLDNRNTDAAQEKSQKDFDSAATEATFSAMIDDDISKLSATVPREKTAEFVTEAWKAKSEFFSAREAVMANPKLNAEEKRNQVVGLYNAFVDTVEGAQGRINGPLGQATKATQKESEKNATEVQKKNIDFRKEFEERLKSTAEKLAMDDRIAMRDRNNDAQEKDRANAGEILRDFTTVPDESVKFINLIPDQPAPFTPTPPPQRKKH